MSTTVSIITPTYRRQYLLPAIYRCLSHQTFTDFEWLVLDDSDDADRFLPGLSDRRVVYVHETRRRSVGEKRNILIDRARGDIIAHFDDDDYYGPDYLSQMLSALRTVDFVKLLGFFIYARQQKVLAYWNLQSTAGPHYRMSATSINLTTIVKKDNTLGYGFSYLYRRRVWDHVKFPDVGWNEDEPFALQASQKFKMIGIHDTGCSCLHILHGANTSDCFPQFLIPNFMLDRIFPGLDGYFHSARGQSPEPGG